MKMKTTFALLFVFVVILPSVHSKAILEDRLTNDRADLREPGIDRTDRRYSEVEPRRSLADLEGSRLKIGRANGINFARGALRRARPQRTRSGSGTRRRPTMLRRTFGRPCRPCDREML
ncbi:uncharacterized protein LOC134230117 [Saccostrea cucullata]|uniref:uncharacterized protein LOC134230117 n=1 Tax=Saccostrea cuccullata TaxID=36930 RepID=UPI002ED17393